MARTISRIALVVGLTIGTGLEAAPQSTTTVIQLADGNTIEGIISGRIALGRRLPSAVRLVNGADIERIDADGVRIRRGAIVLAGSVSAIASGDRAKYLDSATTSRLPILDALAAAERTPRGTRWAVAIPERSQMAIALAPAPANLVLRGVDAAILGEYRTANGRSELLETLTVNGPAGQTRVPTSSIAMSVAPPPGAGASALSDDEYREAAAFAAEFSSRLRATPDVAALGDLFVANFGRRVRDHLDGSTPDASMLRAFWLVTPTPEALAQLTDDQALRVFTATANFWSQVWIRRFSEAAFGTGPGLDPLRTLLPRDVTEILTGDPVLRDRPDRSLAQLLMPRETRPTVDVAAHYMAAAATLDRAATALRAVNDAARAQESRHYRDFERTLTEQITTVRGRATPLARALTCQIDCGVLPPGTRIIEIMALPFLHLHLIRTAAGLRIHAIDLVNR